MTGRYVCPSCGNEVAETGDGVCDGVRGRDGQPGPRFVYLVQHDLAPGRPCPGWHARVDS